MNVVRAGEELKFGAIGKSIRLQTNSNSIRCEILGEGTETTQRYVATRSGYLHAESQGINLTKKGKSESKQKKDKMQIDILPYNSNKYQASEGDTVIGIVTMRNPEFYQLDIGADTVAVLNSQEFQGATRKDRPNYTEGTLIYCRVLSADKFGKVQLSCINPLDKKAWNTGEAFFKDLKGGFVKELPIAYCRQNLLSQTKSDYLFEQLGQIFTFELCIGFNGKVWFKSERAVDTILIMNATQRIVDLSQENDIDWHNSDEFKH